MIHLTVEVCDLDCEKSKVITLPCNLRAELADHSDYIIESTWPEISISRNDCIGELNDILDEINSENPGMTAEYLKVLIDASSSGDLFDKEFARKIRENDFMFCDISDIRMPMDAEEIAAYCLATEHKVPFDHGITQDVLEAIGNEALVDYINWEQIWEQYESIGFQLVLLAGTVNKSRKRYVVHIK